MRARAARLWLGALCAAVLATAGLPPPAQAAFDDYLFALSAGKEVPPGSGFRGPCGLAVDVGGNIYVSDYHHHTVDVFRPDQTYITQLAGVDPLDGPCGLALDSTGRLYVNDFHRDVVRYTPSAYPPGSSTTFGVGSVVDSGHPTGVAVNMTSDDVYVNRRTQIAAYTSAGAPLPALQIGLGSLGDGYGLAISRFSLTAGRLYVADAADDTVKVYDPAVDVDDPVATITGPPGGFGSLVDAAIAIDRMTGEIYVSERVGSRLTANPESAIRVFDHTGAYKGRLKYNVVDAVPVGLAVDNTVGATQGRVYVTSGNSTQSKVYAYPPGAATLASLPAASAAAETAQGAAADTAVGSSAPGVAIAPAPAPQLAGQPAGAGRVAGRRARHRHRRGRPGRRLHRGAKAVGGRESRRRGIQR